MSHRPVEQRFEVVILSTADREKVAEEIRRALELCFFEVRVST